MHLIARPARRCLRGGVAFALVCFASVASADVAFPDELPPAVPAQQSAPLPLTVAEDAATPVHRIVIPKTVLATFGVTGSFRMWSGSSANFTGIDKDLTCSSGLVPDG